MTNLFQLSEVESDDIANDEEMKITRYKRSEKEIGDKYVKHVSEFIPTTEFQPSTPVNTKQSKRNSLS